MSSDVKDDVDRLFDCFKCGLTPPLSAVKEGKKICRGHKKDVGLKKGEAIASLSPHSANRPNHPTTDVLLHTEQVDESAVKVISNSGHRFSPVVFYGSPHGVPAKKPLHILRLLREIHVDLSEQTALNLRKEVWATFPKQDEAVRYAKAHTGVRLFSYQDHLNGQRRFLVSTYEEFWRRYKNMNPKFRHHYEVIQEGFPCHLYFDLEFNKSVNPEKNGAEMVKLLISIIFESLYDKFSIKGEDDWTIELDSSTKEKFSRHLIIRIPGTAFKDNSHVGEFVAEVCSVVRNSRGGDPRFDDLYVSKESSAEVPSQLFLDTAVYSRNRCFRLALSSKAGKSSVLLPTRRFKCKNMSEEEMFMESLICRMDVDCKKLLTCKMDLDCKKVLFFDSEVNTSHPESSETMQELEFHACSSKLPGAYFSGRSPFPALDVFVESIASIGDVSGRIRCWYWFSEYGLMVYNMSRNRYCERIGRQHKSNHVMYIVDFKRAGYYQKCYDPDCKGYRSPLRPIPRNIIPDNVAVFNSTWTDHYQELLNVNFNLQHGQNIAQNSSEIDYGVTDSCKKDGGWWLEAIRIANEIENIPKEPNFDISDKVDNCQDYEWWMEVERATSQIEEQAGKIDIEQ